jgi:Flp pilus assembly protein TadG
MRTIFITPLLWKRLNRSALRRGEEGQAIVLIAFVAIGMVAMVGLAIDGGLGYLESTRPSVLPMPPPWPG